MEGGCYCGAIRYRSTGKPMLKGQCHCRECQYITGGGPNFFMTVPSDGFTVTQGEMASFTRSDLERPVTREFCPACGTHIRTQLGSLGLSVLKIGTLDDPEGDFRGPKMAIYVKDTQPYMTIPEGMTCFDALPPRA